MKHLALRMGMTYSVLVNKVKQVEHTHGNYYLTNDEEIKLRNIIKQDAEKVLIDLAKK